MEDLDTPRVVSGAEDEILATLQRLGLTHDGPIERQSQRRELYANALQVLRESGHAYRCLCSRAEAAQPYDGRCREAQHSSEPCAWRLRMEDAMSTSFVDRFQGPIRLEHRALGDPVLFRRDGIAAYQLAVVVDDLAQGITHVVRGADLLESTGWQLRLIAALGGQPPAYAHVPLLVEPGGAKLAKSRRSVPLAGLEPGVALLQALRLLRQKPHAALERAPVSEILSWAVGHWDPGAFAGVRSLELN